jgi:hypothetical protein
MEEKKKPSLRIAVLILSFIGSILFRGTVGGMGLSLIVSIIFVSILLDYLKRNKMDAKQVGAK